MSPKPSLWVGFAYGGAIFRSGNLGWSWRETGLIEPGLWVRDVVFEHDSARGYASTFGSGLLKTVDYGRTWTKLPSLPIGDLLHELEIDAVGRLYAVSSDDNLWRSSDHGTSWEALVKVDGNLHDLAIDPEKPGHLFVASTFDRILFSDDDGVTWSLADQGLDNRPALLEWDRAEKPRLWAAVCPFGDVYRRSNQAWQRIGGIGYVSITSLAFDPEDQKTIWLGSAEGLYKSVDEGETWDLVAFEGEIVRELLWLDRPWSKLLVGTDEGVYTRLGPGDWRKTSHGLNDARIGSIAVGSGNSDVVYAGSRDCRSRMFTSPVGGKLWEASAPLLDTGCCAELGALVVRPGEPSNAVVGLGPRVFETVDSGSSWSEQESVTGRIKGLVFESHRPGWLFATTNSGIWRTDNLSEDWENVLSGYPFDIFAGIDNAKRGGGLWAGAARSSVGPVVSLDQGESWRPSHTGFLCPGGAGVIAVDPFNAQTVYGGCASVGGLRRTRDGGRSWEIVEVGNDNGYVAAIAMDPMRQGFVYLASGGRLWLSCNGGAAWQEVEDFPAKAWRLGVSSRGTLHVGTRFRGVYSADLSALVAHCAG